MYKQRPQACARGCNNCKISYCEGRHLTSDECIERWIIFKHPGGNLEVVTLKEALLILKETYNYEVSAETIKTWVKRGIIDGPIDILGLKGSETGGRQGRYSDDWPDTLAAVLFFKDNGNALSKIGLSRRIALGIINNKLHEIEGIDDFYSLIDYYREERKKTSKFFETAEIASTTNGTDFYNEFVSLISKTPKKIEIKEEKYELVNAWLLFYYKVNKDFGIHKERFQLYLKMFGHYRNYIYQFPIIQFLYIQ